ncbi:MAG: N-acetyltransferase [Saprospiraceae bacterium]|nr:GNAT family N-acetyltransferase [Bacteroidia bacterium]NNE14323.1 N-acetyltransferase [Saprospiraceae bacterium]NNL91960.1 N-acetyltransferase [Saprospiraceae bacterium]
MIVKPFDQRHYKQISSIYKEGLQTGIATLETEVPDWESWDLNHHTFCRIAVFDGQQILGWGALSPVSKREVYSGVAEVSVYVSRKCFSQGIGSVLMKTLIEESEKNGIWTLQSSVFESNDRSLRLHQKFGFRKVGYRERIGQRNGVWINTIILERRSSKI